MPSRTDFQDASNGAARSDDSLPKELVDAMQALFGKHPGFRTSMYKTLKLRVANSSTKLILLCFFS